MCLAIATSKWLRPELCLKVYLGFEHLAIQQWICDSITGVSFSNSLQLQQRFWTFAAMQIVWWRVALWVGAERSQERSEKRFFASISSRRLIPWNGTRQNNTCSRALLRNLGMWRRWAILRGFCFKLLWAMICSKKLYDEGYCTFKKLRGIAINSKFCYPAVPSALLDVLLQACLHH